MASKKVPLKEIRKALKLIKNELYKCEHDNFLRANTMLVGIADLQMAAEAYKRFRDVMIASRLKKSDSVS